MENNPKNFDKTSLNHYTVTLVLKQIIIVQVIKSTQNTNKRAMLPKIQKNSTSYKGQSLKRDGHDFRFLRKSISINVGIQAT